MRSAPARWRRRCWRRGRAATRTGYAAFVPMGRIGQPDEIADAVCGCCPTKPATSLATPCPSMAVCVPYSSDDDVFWVISI